MSETERLLTAVKEWTAFENVEIREVNGAPRLTLTMKSGEEVHVTTPTTTIWLIPLEENCLKFDIFRKMSTKRENYLGWEEYFMGVALLAAQRSKDPVRQVGACIVNEENKIVGVGYNGFPRNCSDDEFPWGKDADSELDNKYLYVCHAELNAILNAYSSKAGCRIYVTLFPCNECAKSIIQSGIKEVIFLECNKKHKETAAAQRMFSSAEVTTRRFLPQREKIVLNLKPRE